MISNIKLKANIPDAVSNNDSNNDDHWLSSVYNTKIFRNSRQLFLATSDRCSELPNSLVQEKNLIQMHHV